jgi:hypothetical protein
MRPTVEEDSQAGARMLWDTRNEVGQRFGISSIDPAECFGGYRTTILEVTSGDQMSLVHG